MRHAAGSRSSVATLRHLCFAHTHCFIRFFLRSCHFSVHAPFLYPSILHTTANTTTPPPTLFIADPSTRRLRQRFNSTRENYSHHFSFPPFIARAVLLIRLTFSYHIAFSLHHPKFFFSTRIASVSIAIAFAFVTLSRT